MSKIEWTDQTWNPIIGCSKISPGCDNCYAEKLAGRLANISSTIQYIFVTDWEHKHWNNETKFITSALEKPLLRKIPTKYFVCSMGDLFHESVPFDWIDRVMEVIKHCPQHTFQILTKRPEQMKRYFDFKDIYAELPNVWLGVSAEKQTLAIDRILTLLEVPAYKRFVSLEPLLEKINLLAFLPPNDSKVPLYENYPFLDWVILGGESGPNARPMHPYWVESIRDQCQAANVPFFFKQWGEWIDIDNGYTQVNSSLRKLKKYTFGSAYTSHDVYRVGKKQAGRLLYGKEYNEFPK